MKVIDERLLDEFRAAARCELCGRPTPNGAHPHHLSARGMGGGARVDVRANLMALCYLCHRIAHDGNVSRRSLLEIVAKREGCSVQAILDEVWKWQRTPKE